MTEGNTHTLIVVGSSCAPSLSLMENQCILVGTDEINVDDILYLPDLDVEVKVRSLNLLLAGLRPATKTECGHRFIIEFREIVVPNDVSASYRFEIRSPTR